MSQNHFTLRFPLKSPASAKAVAEQLPKLVPGLFQAADSIGRNHYSRFTSYNARARGAIDPLLSGHALFDGFDPYMGVVGRKWKKLNDSRIRTGLTDVMNRHHQGGSDVQISSGSGSCCRCYSNVRGKPRRRRTNNIVAGCYQ